MQNGVKYSDTALLGLRIVSNVICRHRMHDMSLVEAYDLYAYLTNAPLDKFFFTYQLGVDAESEDDVWSDWGRLKAVPLTSVSVRKYYSSGNRTKVEFLMETLELTKLIFSCAEEEKWSCTLGAVLLKSQERGPPSPYELLHDLFASLLNGKAQFGWLDQGIYTLGCLFNHSCVTNLQVT